MTGVQVAIALVLSVAAFCVMLAVEVVRSLKHTREVAHARAASRTRRKGTTMFATPTLGHFRDRDYDDRRTRWVLLAPSSTRICRPGPPFFSSFKLRAPTIVSLRRLAWQLHE